MELQPNIHLHLATLDSWPSYGQRQKQHQQIGINSGILTEVLVGLVRAQGEHKQHKLYYTHTQSEN